MLHEPFNLGADLVDTFETDGTLSNGLQGSSCLAYAVKSFNEVLHVQHFSHDPLNQVWFDGPLA